MNKHTSENLEHGADLADPVKIIIQYIKYIKYIQVHKVRIDLGLNYERKVK